MVRVGPDRHGDAGSGRGDILAKDLYLVDEVSLGHSSHTQHSVETVPVLVEGFARLPLLHPTRSFHYTPLK